MTRLKERKRRKEEEIIKTYIRFKQEYPKDKYEKTINI